MRALVGPMVNAVQSLRQIADPLNAAGHKTARGSAWSHKTVGFVVQHPQQGWARTPVVVFGR